MDRGTTLSLIATSFGFGINNPKLSKNVRPSAYKAQTDTGGGVKKPREASLSLTANADSPRCSANADSLQCCLVKKRERGI
jgi:hypothetical protein